MKITSAIKRLEALDKKYIWHPFTQMKEWEASTPLIITEGQGSYLKDLYGRWYLDGIASLWTNIHGHRRREIDEAIKSQIDKISHSTFLGLTHPHAIMLAERLNSITPPSLSRVFYSDDGSTAVEIALKIAYQYYQHKGMVKKSKFFSLKNAYHGDTIAAVSVGGIELFHQIFSPLLFDSFKGPSPYCYRCELLRDNKDCSLACLNKIEEIFKSHSDEIAAFIIEPMVQGAGGMILSPPAFLKGIERLCRKYDVLLIADEVATGFGRTGKMFACEHEDVNPDMMCLAKGITGGYLPLAATLTTEEIYNVFLGEYDEFKTFFHGHTYTGNQLGCVAALASLDIFEKDMTINRMQMKVTNLRRELERIISFSHVGEIRQCGFMVGIELVKNQETKEPYPPKERMGFKVCHSAREAGLIIRPLGDVVVLMPPLSVSHDELKRIIDITASSIEKITH